MPSVASNHGLSWASWDPSLLMQVVADWFFIAGFQVPPIGMFVASPHRHPRILQFLLHVVVHAIQRALIVF